MLPLMSSVSGAYRHNCVSFVDISHVKSTLRDVLYREQCVQVSLGCEPFLFFLYMGDGEARSNPDAGAPIATTAVRLLPQVLSHSFYEWLFCSECNSGFSKQKKRVREKFQQYCHALRSKRPGPQQQQIQMSTMCVPNFINMICKDPVQSWDN